MVRFLLLRYKLSNVSLFKGLNINLSIRVDLNSSVPLCFLFSHINQPVPRWHEVQGLPGRLVLGYSVHPKPNQPDSLEARAGSYLDLEHRRCSSSYFLVKLNPK